MPSLMTSRRTACVAVDTHRPHYSSIGVTMHPRYQRQEGVDKSRAHNLDPGAFDYEQAGTSSGYNHHRHLQHQHRHPSTSFPPPVRRGYGYHQFQHSPQRWRTAGNDNYVSFDSENSHPSPRPYPFQHPQEVDQERLVPSYFRMRPTGGSAIMEEATTNARNGASSSGEAADRMVVTGQPPQGPPPLPATTSSMSPTRGSALSSRGVEYQTTADGDVVVVQPSFDEAAGTGGGDPKAGAPPNNGKEWMASAGAQDLEERNPSPRRPLAPGHSRNLSAHFYDATSLDDRDPGLAESESIKGKHRRLFSGDISNPNFAHRRLDSAGLSSAVRRDSHRRVDSAGLDMLSAVADATKDELELAAGSKRERVVEARQSIGLVSEGSYEQPPSSMMAPPANTGPSQSSMSSYPPPPPPPPHYMVPQQPPPPHAHYPSGHQYPMYYYGPPPPYHHPGSYPVQAPQSGSALSSEPRADTNKKQPTHTRPNHQGSQTFVTAIAVGQGTKTMKPTLAADDINVGGGSSIPSQVGRPTHHRKMSSFSSLGTIIGSSLFSPNGGQGDDAKQHHRHTSSSLSFLAGLEGLEGADDAFLRNLSNDVQQQQQQQQSVATAAVSRQQKLRPMPAPSSQARRPSPTAPASSMASAGTQDSGISNPDAKGGEAGGLKMAAGGTSKRVRRKCTVQGCPNRVVQGGLCISHGAKRKQCKHPGCTKNVKKAGLCSTHGPARKRCEFEGCGKVAVQGGRCIAHGAKKKLCFVEGCTKQAILAGMCKKHHDQKNAQSGQNKTAGVRYSQEVTSRSGAASSKHKSQHTRGLSIFQEFSADAVSDLLNESTY